MSPFYVATEAVTTASRIAEVLGGLAVAGGSVAAIIRLNDRLTDEVRPRVVLGLSAVMVGAILLGLAGLALIGIALP
jgi:hypothetical protein